MIMKDMIASFKSVLIQLCAQLWAPNALLDSSANDFWVHSAMVGSTQDAKVGAGRTAYDPVGVFGGADMPGKLTMSLDVQVPVTSSRVTCRQV